MFRQQKHNKILFLVLLTQLKKTFKYRLQCNKYKKKNVFFSYQMYPEELWAGRAYE